MQCPQCQQDNPSHAKFCLECGTRFGRIHEVNKPAVAYEEVQRALSEALEQQTATAEILRVISRSPNDVQPVFDSIAASALRLCDAKLCTTFTFDGELIHLVASHHVTEEGAAAYRDAYPSRPGRASGTHRAILTRTIVHIPDIREDPEYELRALARANDYGCVLAVPMLRDGHPVGAITVGREAARPFPSEQIALLRTFAQQAVIAIENVRLFTELQASNRELITALATQTATSDILRVISRSQTDVHPVFDAIVVTAVRLLGAYTATLTRLAGDQVVLAALTSIDEAVDAAQRARFPQSLHSDGPHAQAIRGRAPLNIADAFTEPRLSEAARTYARARGYRSLVVMTLLRHGDAIGSIGVTRLEPGGFTDDEIELLKTFADQAVIAIENVRLFKELEGRNRDLSEALDRQTGTADVLRIIAQSPTELQPVLEAIATSALRLCAASDVLIERLEGDRFYNAAHAGAQMKGLVGLPLPLTRRFPGGRAILDRKRIIIDDMQLVAESEYPDTLELLKLNTVHSCAEIPLLSEGKPLGNLAVLRAEVRPFTDGEITLLETFADQAVIAIENVRLFTQLQQKNQALTEAHAQVSETLEQQTATGEILRTIAHTQTDVQPVFDTIVRSAARLCHAVMAAVLVTDGRMLHLPANYGSSPEALAAVRARYPRPLDRETVSGAAILTRSVVHVPDVQELSVVEFSRQTGQVLGYRSLVTVPMLREGEVVGAITVCRREPGRFSDAEVELLQTFADQAVIAIENVRLFKELQARTGELTRSVDQLTALGEISQAVSSTLDVETVLQTIVSRASQLAGADGCAIYEYDDATEAFHIRATHNLDPVLVETLRAAPLRKGEGAMGRAAETREPTQVADIAAPGADVARLRAQES